MELSRHIHIEQGFQSSVNITYDLSNDDKVRGFIPTLGSLEVLEDMILSTFDNSNDRSRILVGAYGKGKSHIVLVLLALLYKKDITLFTRVLEHIKDYSLELYTYITGYLESKKRLLPVVIQGSNISLTQSFLGAIQKTLEDESLDDLMPDTHFQAALNAIERWKEEYQDTYQKFIELLDEPINDFCVSLSEYNVFAYEKFERLYPTLTSGSEFNPFLGFNVVELYSKIVDALCERGYSGIYVVYDEFSKYLESSILKASIADIKMLQDFAEKCNRSKEKQMHLLLISHKDIANYIDKLPKQKVDGWKGVSERFKHIEIQNNFSQIYELIAAVINKDQNFFVNYYTEHNRKFTEIEEEVKDGMMYSELEEPRMSTVVYDCYPLHPVTTFILPRLSELVAQNERTLFTFLSSTNRSTLSAFLRNCTDEFPILTPDYLYDYFEPLFKKEPYTSDIRKLYTTASSILNRIGSTGLDAKIIKTILLIYVVNQFEKLAPTPELLIRVYKDSVKDTSEIAAVLEDLQNKKFVIYMKRSNHFLRLKNTTGSDIRKRIADTVEKNRGVFDVKRILSESPIDMYLYPTQYNDEMDIIRYFDFAFIYGNDFLEVNDWSKRIENNPSDGVMFGIIVDSQEQIEMLTLRITSQRNVDERILFVLPKEFTDIQSVAYEYQAVKILRDEAGEDESLVAEYNIYAEDLEEVIEAFVYAYTKPELHACSYFHRGIKQAFYRKAQISQRLSEICWNLYTHTPVVNNEPLNKDILSPVAINSRNKVVKGLLAKKLEPMLGLSGTGQDISFMRSSLIMTGLVEDINDQPKLRIHGNPNTAIQHVIDVIERFILDSQNSGGSNFKILYNQLTKPEHHIGLKRGIIPIFLAVVLHHYKGQLVIMSGESEIEISVDLINSINEEPHLYTAFLEVWNADKAKYISELEELFSDYIIEKEREYNSFAFITRAMQRWFISLPKYSKDISVLYCGNDRYDGVEKEQTKFLTSLRSPNINAHEYLFEKLPQIFSPVTINTGLIDKLKKAKSVFDLVKNNLIEVLIKELIEIFDPDAANGVTLPSAFRDWCDGLSDSTKIHIFDGTVGKIFQLIQSATNDHSVLVERLAKAATGLRIDDWNDSTVSKFIETMRSFKNAVEEFDKDKSPVRVIVKDGYKLSFIDANGQENMKTFARVKYGRIGNLLKNEIKSALEEMGLALSEDEKRQVLMEIIKELC